MRIALPVLVALAVTSCGTADELSRVERGKKKKKSPSPEVTELEEDQGERKLAEPVPEPEAPKDSVEPKAKPVTRKPLPGWVDSGTGYRFHLLEDDATFTVADVESEDFALFLDLSAEDRKEATVQKQKSEDDAFNFVAVIAPQYAGYAELVRAVVRGLESFGASLEGPGRRKSLCERKLGEGWHYPTQQLVQDADEDDVRQHVEKLEGKSVWLAGRFGASKHSYTFVKGAAGTEQWVLDDPKLASLCVLRAH